MHKNSLILTMPLFKCFLNIVNLAGWHLWLSLWKMFTRDALFTNIFYYSNFFVLWNCLLMNMHHPSPAPSTDLTSNLPPIKKNIHKAYKVKKFSLPLQTNKVIFRGNLMEKLFKIYLPKQECYIKNSSVIVR